MEIEAGTLVTPRGVTESARMKLRGKGSLYGETVVTPGFSDAHAHPQVIDAGEGRWSNAYEWIRNRRLKVDEAALRADLDLSSKLAAASMLRSLLDGVTLMALVGRGDANVLAYRKLPVKPRVVVMPTIMDLQAGWPDAWRVTSLLLSVSALDGAIPLGFFIHSIGCVTPESLRAAYSAAKELGVPFSIHLSEGIDELPTLVSLLNLRKGEDSKIIGVHCISGSGYKEYGIRVVHCPLSNLRLYGKTIGRPGEVDAVGSDWPLLLGSAAAAYKAAVKVHGRGWASYLLSKSTVGGYELFGIGWEGDVLVFDEPLEKVLEGSVSPRFVLVKGEVAVEEGRLVKLDLGKDEVDKKVRELIKEAVENYPARCLNLYSSCPTGDGGAGAVR